MLGSAFTTPVYLEENIPLLPAYQPEISGQVGRFRVQNSGCAASTDYEIAAAFLVQWESSKHTFVNYRKELNRYMAWLVTKNLGLSDVCFEHAVLFMKYLADPPADQIGEGRAYPLHHSKYRPFTKKLAPQSRQQTVRILNSFYKFMVQQRYTEFNPFAALNENAIRADKRQSADDRPLAAQPQDRCIELDVIKRIQAALLADLEERPGNQGRERQLWVLTLFYMTGTRREEIAHGFMADFKPFGSITGGYHWQLYVIGKGQKPRNIPVMPELLDALARYRRLYNLPPLPREEEDKTRSIIMSLSGKKSVGAQMIYQILVDLFSWFKNTLDPSDPDTPYLSAKIDQYSTHWLRHTFATQLMNNGTPIAQGAKILGHSNPATSAIYVQSNDAVNWNEVDRALPRLQN